ncbi:MAG: LCP family protein [Anaerolineae bacterium]|nr:LCP family protein [Anaerolineae bacterium]
MDDPTIPLSSANNNTEPVENGDLPANTIVHQPSAKADNQQGVSHAELTQPALPRPTTNEYANKTRPARSIPVNSPVKATLPASIPAPKPPPTPVQQKPPPQPIPPQTYPTYAPKPVQPPMNYAQPVVAPTPQAPLAPPRQNWSVVALALGALLLTLTLGVGTLIGVRLISANAQNTANAAVLNPTTTATPLPTFSPYTATPDLHIEPWNGSERFTVLLMGLDKRPGESGTAFRTDSMILISIDPATHSIGMLSVPRDLYVDIPPDTVVGSGYGLQRVNSAYVIGELARPGYGPQLAMQTVQYNLGMRINDYIVFDFSTVVDAVNAVGGIDIDVKTSINDPAYPDMNYGYDPLYIPAGLTHMDGNLALKYARSRHQTNDFDRARRQQEVITAVRGKILDLNMLPDLIAQAPNLWGSMSRNIQTGLSLEQLLKLVVYVKDIPPESIKQGVIDYGFVTPTMWDGASVLVPNRASLGPLLVQVFGANYNQ